MALAAAKIIPPIPIEIPPTAAPSSADQTPNGRAARNAKPMGCAPNNKWHLVNKNPAVNNKISLVSAAFSLFLSISQIFSIFFAFLFENYIYYIYTALKKSAESAVIIRLFRLKNAKEKPPMS
jgi:hypothetical protein